MKSLSLDKGDCQVTLKSSRAFFQWAAALTISLALSATQITRAQSQPTGTEPPKTAEQVFKNIQVLKGRPADQVIPSMQFITAALGVRCEHCHVEGAFEKDDKKPKQTARLMMQMMFAVNQNNFEGKREVTCNTCHRGSLQPLSIPVVATETVMKRETPAAPPSISETEILDKYLQVIGGTALEKINTEVAKGKATIGQGVELPVEIYVKNPDHRAVVTHMNNGESLDILNGTSGWILNPGRPVREMNADEARASRIDADLRLAADIRDLFPQIKVLPDQEIDGHAVNVLRATSPDRPPVELSFDKQSGLLLRMVRYVDSPLGLNPTQIDYADYRDVNGAKFPFQLTIARPQGRFTMRLDQVQMNVPIDDSKFTKPEAPSTTSH